MRIGEVAERAGVRVSLIRYYEGVGLLPEPQRVSGQRHGNDPMSERLRELADRRLPEIHPLLERAQRVREWLVAAQGCGCTAIDDCRLFDDAAAPPRGSWQPAVPESADRRQVERA